MTDYLTGQLRKTEERMHDAIDRANDLFFEIVKQLVLVVTVLLTLSSPIAGGWEAVEITREHPWLFIISWALLVVSLTAGLWQLLFDFNYFRRVGRLRQKIVDEISDGKIKENNISQRMEAIQKAEPQSSGSARLYVQVLALVFAVMLQTIAYISLVSADQKSDKRHHYNKSKFEQRFPRWNRH